MGFFVQFARCKYLSSHLLNVLTSLADDSAGNL